MTIRIEQGLLRLLTISPDSRLQDGLLQGKKAIEGHGSPKDSVDIRAFPSLYLLRHRRAEVHVHCVNSSKESDIVTTGSSSMSELTRKIGALTEANQSSNTVHSALRSSFYSTQHGDLCMAFRYMVCKVSNLD